MIELYEVGGCVRDSLLGIDSKDIDFTVIAPSYEDMREFLTDAGFEIFLETPEYFTIRARFPKVVTHDAIPTRFVRTKKLPTADFVLARKEGAYSDGRRPDEVQMGTLLDDLSRRDFTMNAMARDRDGRLIDPFGGQQDVKER
jgi:tRNA nucleotidyltransferase (CCA-adding enzyme)